MGINLGDIINEMNLLAVQHPKILTGDVRTVPKEDILFYSRYQYLKDELNKFGRKVESLKKY
jgi:hypothetical protein